MFDASSLAGMLFAMTLLTAVVVTVGLSTVAAMYRDVQELKLRLAQARLGLLSVAEDLQKIADKTQVELDAYDGLLSQMQPEHDQRVIQAQWHDR